MTQKYWINKEEFDTENAFRHYREKMLWMLGFNYSTKMKDEFDVWYKQEYEDNWNLLNK